MGTVGKLGSCVAIAVLVAACGKDGPTATDGLWHGPSFYSGGISGYSGETADCTECHDSPNGDPPTVTLGGPTTIAPGATGDYTLTITPAAGSDQAAGGFNVSVSGGTLIAGAGSQIMNGEVTHDGPQAGTGTLSWSFQWTAPGTPGTVTMWGAGNSVNGAQGTNGDEVDTDVLTITVEAANQPPVANDDAYTTDEDVTLTVGA
ncbi:MAG: hypothetical protein GTO22_17335, partial [Gemmatimonadales bacterium]|nr:hypothetical protein [Gemmatimonadales bacterium]